MRRLRPSREKAGAKTESDLADLKEDTLTAIGSADTMVESGSRLFFKYRGGIWSLDKETDKLEQIKEFAEGELNGSFWVYRGGLYYDINSAKGEDSARMYALYRLDLETGEETHLTDLVNQASGIYASRDVLYVSGYNLNQTFNSEGGRKPGRRASGGEKYIRTDTGTAARSFTGESCPIWWSITDICRYRMTNAL